jgi:hypothetical protein
MERCPGGGVILGEEVLAKIHQDVIAIYVDDGGENPTYAHAMY